MEKLRNREIFILLWITYEYYKPNDFYRDHGICLRLDYLVELNIITNEERDEFFKYLQHFVRNVRNSNNSDFIDLLLIENIEQVDSFWFQSNHERQLFLRKLINHEYTAISREVSDRFIISLVQIYYNIFKEVPGNVKGICNILTEIRIMLISIVHIEFNHIFKIVNRLSFIEKLSLGLYTFAIFKPQAGYLTTCRDHDKRRKLISYMLKNKEKIFKK